LRKKKTILCREIVAGGFWNFPFFNPDTPLR
jgi:hypothetical protein